MTLLCPPPTHLRQRIKVDPDLSSKDVCHGRIVCECRNDEMEVYYYGKIQKRIFRTPCVLPFKDDFDNASVIGILLKCKKCGREILLYDSNIHSYNASKHKKRIKKELYQPFTCEKCDNKYFMVDCEFQYLNEVLDDISEVKINNKSSNFDWIVVDLKCQSCLKEYNRFLNHEAIE
ncbi:TPA: hypothetical protein GXZ54_03320 [bacterium]|jgi:hypothetical protein|nr:hypothetical protein [bacterium]